MRTSTDSSGGPVAIRGYLVQTLVALLDIAQSDPPFTKIVLEPAHADDQFDFAWSNDDGDFAVQVKSTINEFTLPIVERLSENMLAARDAEDCRIVLVGDCHKKLKKVDEIDGVAIEKWNLDTPGLFNQAAHLVGRFLEDQELTPGTPSEHELIAEGLVTRLLRYSTTREEFTRDAFIKLLRTWISESPRNERKVDISRIVKYAPPKLIGRETETELLDESWQKVVEHEAGRPHVLGFVALGGEGKTSLAAKWLAELAGKDWPRCESVFAWSFYSQGSREQVAVSSDLFLAEALKFFGDPEMAGSAQGAYEKGQRLAQLVGGQRSLLILDGVEPLQYPPSSPTGSRLKDQGVEALLKCLAASSNGLCIVTTRYSIPDLAAFVGSTWREEKLKRLSREAGVALLKDCNVKGSELRPDPTPENPDPLNEYEQLVEDVKGHALTLQILGQYLKRAHHGDIRRVDRVELAKADDKVVASSGFGTGHAFRAIAAYEAWLADDGEESQQELAVLRLLGLFDRPASADCVQALRQAPAIDGLTDPLVDLPDADWEFTLSALSDARLVSVNRNESTGELLSLDAHPLIREYFAMQLCRPDQAQRRSGDPQSGDHADAGASSLRSSIRPTETSEVWRAAHRRLYEHLCHTTKEGDQPTLEDLQPLYQAVAHGCHAGMHEPALDSVYEGRICRGEEYYSGNKLGAVISDLAGITCFFDAPWLQPHRHLPQDRQIWLLNEAGLLLTTVGRLTEAIVPMRAAVNGVPREMDMQFASRMANNLCEIELKLGNVARSIEVAKRSIGYADSSPRDFWGEFLSSLSRAHLADALHAAGETDDSKAQFMEAERLQADRQPQYPLLCSVQGFWWCGLILAPIERESWKITLDRLECQSPNTPSSCVKDGDEVFRAVTGRAKQSRKIAEANNWLLDTALDCLTLARVALYESLVTEAVFSSSAFEIEEAVSGLRRAGAADSLPHALLTRAWQRRLLGRNTGPDSAQSDLDEAWEIASRGPMPLFMADIHLYRARLFGVGPVPTGRIDGGTDDEDGRSEPALPEYPWKSVEHDLSEARRLIEKYGYGRRMGELEDAEKALLPNG